MSEDAEPRSPVDVARQLRETADRLVAAWTAVPASALGAASKAARSSWKDLPGLPGVPELPELPKLPKLPATVSAEQVQRILDDLAARRAQVKALRDSLTAFDEQLESLESGLQSALEWTRAWADLEKSIDSFWQSLRGGAQR